MLSLLWCPVQGWNAFWSSTSLSRVGSDALWLWNLTAFSKPKVVTSRGLIKLFQITRGNGPILTKSFPPQGSWTLEYVFAAWTAPKALESLKLTTCCMADCWIYWVVWLKQLKQLKHAETVQRQRRSNWNLFRGPGKKVSENRCQTVQRFQVIEIEIEPIASNCYQLLVFEFIYEFI